MSQRTEGEQISTGGPRKTAPFAVEWRYRPVTTLTAGATALIADAIVIRWAPWCGN